MTTPPAIIAVDIDGTLLSRRGTVLPGTRAEFARARAAGAMIVLASGRPVPGLRRLVHRLRLPVSGLVLAGSNGAVSVDAESGEVLARHCIDPTTLRRIMELAAEHDVLTMVCDDTELVVDRPADPQVAIEADGNDLTVRGVSDLRLLRPDEVRAEKVLMYGHPSQLRPFAETFATLLGGEVEQSFSAPFYYEATARGVDKGSAVADLAAARGLDLASSVAFGDNGNDIPMIRRAGLGVAMGNAIPEVKEVSDRITASNDDDGIARVLADLFGGGEPAPEVETPDVAPLYHREVDLTDENASFGVEAGRGSGGDTT